MIIFRNSTVDDSLDKTVVLTRLAKGFNSDLKDTEGTEEKILQTQTTAPAPVKKATAGFIISLIAGIIDAIVALILLAAASFIGQLGETIPGLGGPMGLGVAETFLTTWAAIGLILAVLVIIGAILIYMPGREVVGGILVLIFSIISLPFTAGGLIIGLILGIIGGALGIAKK